MGSAACAPAPGPAACAPQFRTEERTVMVPQAVAEMQKVCVTEYRNEERSQEVTVCKQVPETVQKTRTYTVYEQQPRSRQENYTVCKPVYRDVVQNYTVCVPYTKTQGALAPSAQAVLQRHRPELHGLYPLHRNAGGHPDVCRPSYRDVVQNYTVCVPYTETRTGTRTVCRPSWKTSFRTTRSASPTPRRAPALAPSAGRPTKTSSRTTR